MTIPLDSTSSSRSDRELEKPFCQSTSTARLLQAYFTAKVLVSRFVATIGRAFRSLWRESDMGGQVKWPIGVEFATTPSKSAQMDDALSMVWSVKRN